MLPEDVKGLSPLDRLLYWIKERESIRVKRSLGLPPPWTDDPILQRFRFCNVRRADDAVSDWLYRRWYKPNKDHPNMLAAAAVARFVNLPASLESLGRWLFRDGFPKWDLIKSDLRYRASVGFRVFNGAYIVRGNDGVDKIGGVIDHFVRPLVEVTRPTVDSSSMERTWAAVVSAHGFGSFMAGQVVADLRWALTGSWRDKRSWAPMGPGSARGLARLVYRRDEWESVARDYVSSSAAKDGSGAWSSDFKEHVLEVIPARISPDLAKRLEAMDYQNCLCEWDGYERTLWGEGRKKELFRGPGVKYGV